MQSSEHHRDQAIAAAGEAIRKGHHDAGNLRALLIFTTSTPTSQMIESYFAAHHYDAGLLASLVDIALEGDDAGDAPWAAANVLAELPVELLLPHRASLLELSRHEWSYLHQPARQALARLENRDA
ncbi:hypothetical protein [Roseateles toxinivorans]|uniref:hypothetical protein n=1 Tax=Roseateles toxinivorans TaxID=270368 RepID=UPI00105B2D69|nr:hypothetical protein [Roseateles toxinivorans]